MNSPGKWYLYALFILAVTGLFLYLRFPAGIVNQYLTRQAGKFFAPYEIRIGRVSPAFPPGLILREISLQRGLQPYFQVEWLKITPAYMSLFKPGRTLLISSEAYGGSIDCKVNITRGAKGARVLATTTLAHVELEKAAWLREIVQRNIAGRLSGNILLDTSLSADPLRASLRMTDGRIDLIVPVFNQKNFTFNLVETDITLSRQRMLIKRCLFRGTQIEGDLTGSVSLRTPFGESSLALSGVFKLQPDFARQLKKSLPEGFLPRQTVAGGYPIRFSGTLDKPGFSLK